MLVSSLAQFSDGDSLCSPVSVNMTAHMESQERENPSQTRKKSRLRMVCWEAPSVFGPSAVERNALGKDVVARYQQDLSKDWVPLCRN